MPDHILLSSELLFQEMISPLIYGDFIEPLNDLLPGMWAEKIQDRSFAGPLQPNYVWPPGTDWTGPRWKPFVAGQPRFSQCPEDPEDLHMPRAQVHFALDAHQPLAGSCSAQVHVAATGGPPFVAGLLQENLALRAGQRLHFEVHLRGAEPEGAAVQVLLGRHYGVFFRAYARLEFTGISAGWQRFAGDLSSPVDDEGAALAIGISRPGTFWIDKVSLMPADHQCGWRPDVVAAVRALQPGIIRFGGASLIYYQWEQGIGPRETRAPFENHPWGNREENDVGLHEFLQFCELVGAEPLVCLNANSASLAQVMDEIEYCNGPATSTWGHRRAAMGHPEPFGVKYWQIGNEQSGERYEQTLADYARAIRSAHPDLALLASYPSDRILRSLSAEIDYVCPHYYRPCSESGEAELCGLIRDIRRHARNKDLKLGITEWNHTAGHWGWARAWLLTLYNALNAARTLNMYQRLGDMVRIANRSNLTNSCNSGIVQTQRADIYFTPCYYVQRAYATLTGDQALKVQKPAREILDLAATRRWRDGQFALCAVNHTGEAQARIVDLADLEISGSPVEVWTLAGPSLDAVNSFQEKTRISPRESVTAAARGGLKWEFPPYSVTILRFAGAGPWFHPGRTGPEASVDPRDGEALSLPRP